MGKYLGPQATAAALIAKKGTTVTLTRRTATAFDPVTQAETGGAAATETFLAVLMPPSDEARFKVGSLEMRRAMEVYLDAKGRTMRPQPGDTITTPTGTIYTIFWSQTYAPADDGAIFTLAYAE